jgi:hypothetical protein
MTGINSNVDGKQTRIVARYSGSAPAYRARCDEVAAKQYDELGAGLDRRRKSKGLRFNVHESSAQRAHARIKVR